MISQGSIFFANGVGKMDDKDWFVLKTIAEEKNITKAADRLYISQPALTYRLRNLEKEFGAKLVSRHPAGVTLTPQGESVLSYAQEMLIKLRKAKERVQSMENKVQGTLRLGTSSVFAHYILPQILKNFMATYPEVEVSLKTGLSRRINRMFQKEEISVAIVRGDYHWPEEKVLLGEEPICLVSSQPIEFNDLPNLPQISYLTDSSLEPVIQEWWREYFSQPPRITMEVDSMDTCRQMVLHGLGWAILPAIGLSRQGAPFTRELFWRSGEPLLRRTWMIYPSAALELSAVQAFTVFVKTRFGVAECNA